MAELINYNCKCILTTEEIKLLKKNIHCIHFFCSKNKIMTNNNCNNNNCYCYERTFRKQPNNIETDIFFNIDKTIKNFKKYNKKKILTHDDFLKLKLKYPTTYCPRQNKPYTTIHLGQLKLFLSTMQFLLYYCPKDITYVIYPGSAHGYNINFLSELFPQVIWILIDPGKFYKELYKNKKIKIINKLFTDNILNAIKKNVKNKNVLLISDIRLNTDDESIIRDNELQKKWIKELKPLYSQVKFRVPHYNINNNNNSNYKYLNGKIYFQMYPNITTTETRLVIDGKNIKEQNYNIAEYEGIMCYFNRYIRSSYYNHNINNKYVDHCYDCSMLIKLLNDYKKKYKNNNFAKKSITNMINEIYNKIPGIKKRYQKYNLEIKKNLKF